MKLNINKSNWKKVKFGDVVKKVRKMINPDKYESDIIVEGGDINKRDFHIRKYKNKKTLGYLGPAFHMGFKKNQILYVSRNPHLMKVGYPNFDGICANTTYVMQTQNENILRNNLIPFIMLSDTFIEQSVANVRGGVNPYVNWGDLSKIEIYIPPTKEEQAKLAELLWEQDDLIEKERILLSQLEILFKTKIKHISHNNKHKGQYKKIKEVCIIKDNMRRPLNSLQRNKIKGDIPYYGANGLVDRVNDFIYDEELVLIAEDGGNFKDFGSKEIAYKIYGKSWVNNHAHVLSANTRIISSEWLLYSLVHKNILKFITGTTRLKLNKSELENIMIWVPSSKIMKFLSDEIAKINISKKNAIVKLNLSKKLQTILINQIF